MFSEGADPYQQNLLSYPLALQTADADEVASLLAESAVPYRAELLGRVRRFPRRSSSRRVRECTGHASRQLER
jgi:hypothetical protein